MKTKWWSQPFAPEGSATAGGILNQLGRPGLDELTILVREAAQNSWDARAGETVSFGIHISQLGDLAAAWQSVGLPPGSTSGLELKSENWVMRISDRGTYGLRGPVRASERPKDGDGNDFVQFLRNVGEPRDSQYGGGTYGFGKGIFYRVSQASTIIVDSRIRTSNGFERRLMGAALGPAYYSGLHRFTGRHWYGALSDDGIPDPIVDDDAVSIAGQLGFPGFLEHETGTDVVVVLPDFGTVTVEGETRDRSAEEAASHLISAILWNLWPKMVGPDPAMSFNVYLDGRSLSIPNPSEIPHLKVFVSSLQSIASGGGEAYSRGSLPTGQFASTLAPSTPDGGSVADIAKPFFGAPHHVARMRATELVVDYLESSVEIDPGFCFGAVFRATREADQHFANAEPPTHDSWVEQGLARNDLLVVRGARHWVAARLRALYEKTPIASESVQGLGALAARLASLVPTVASIGATPTPVVPRSGNTAHGGSSRSGGAYPSSQIVGNPSVLFKEGRPAVYGVVEVAHREGDYTLRGEIRVVLEGGTRESEPPAGEGVPSILGWETLDGRQLSSTSELKIEKSTPETVFLVGSFVSDVVVRLLLREVNTDG